MSHSTSKPSLIGRRAFHVHLKFDNHQNLKKLKNHRKEIERRLLKKNGVGQMNLVRIINYLLPVILAG